MDKTKTLIIRFNNEIQHDEIPLFRGAIIKATEHANLLFHNHNDDSSFRYSYPLIQYKRINKKAAIVCLGDGTEAIGQFFSSCNFDVDLGERQVRLEVDSVNAHQHLVQIWDGEFAYQALILPSRLIFLQFRLNQSISKKSIEAGESMFSGCYRNRHLDNVQKKLELTVKYPTENLSI